MNQTATDPLDLAAAEIDQLIARSSLADIHPASSAVIDVVEQRIAQLDAETASGPEQCGECGEDIPDGADVFVRGSGAVLHAECVVEPDEPDGP